MTSELINYVVRYGGFCRDCADNDGVCDRGTPCDPKVFSAAIEHTITALKYGIEHGFIESPFAVKVPDVPELKRYGLVITFPESNGFNEKGTMRKDKSGKYVLHSQAAAIIAYWKSECEREVKLATECASDCLAEQKRAEAAEAKLAQIEKQEPVTCRHKVSIFGDESDWRDGDGKGCYPKEAVIIVQSLYTAPVASDADLRAEEHSNLCPYCGSSAIRCGCD